MELENLCMGCMEQKDAQVETCPNCGFVEGTMPESPLYLPPRTILQEKYLIGQVLGQGGFGITYLAWDLNLNVKLAIKEYFPQDLASRAAGHSQVSAYTGSMGSQYEYGLDKFLQEARTLAQFEGHPSIVSVRDFFKANGTAYFVMSYVEGITLKDHLANSGGTLPVEQARGVLLPIMDALKEVHAVNVLHRDISPDNIFINKKGQVILIDFGAARQAIGEKGRSLSIILKPGYAPEEQYRSKGAQGPWTDIYAIAATYYHLITGHQPPEALERLVDDPLELPSKYADALNETEEKALLKALAVRAEDRFQTVEDFQAAILGELPIESLSVPGHAKTSAASQAVQSKSGAEKKSFPLGLGIGLAAVVIIGLGGFALWSGGYFTGETEAVNQGNGQIDGATSQDQQNESVVNLSGNSSGNLINGGLVTSQGDQYYYRSNNGGVLQAGRFGSDEYRVIAADSVWFINVSEDWLYYTNRDDRNRIYKINVDGSGRTALTEEGAWFVTLVDGWLYYLNESDDYRIYKINTAGEGKTRLSEDSAWFLNVEGQWIYYINRDDGDKIYRVRNDAGGREAVNDHPSCCISLADGWIYYSNEADGSRIYRIEVDGTTAEVVNDVPSWFINAGGGWIYYADESDDFSLNKVKVDGTERVKLASEPVRYINQIGDWIYYLDQGGEDNVYRVKKDGTGRSLVDGGF